MPHGHRATVPDRCFGSAADRLATIGPSRDTIEVVPNGIDIEQIRTATRPTERGEPSYDGLFAGRLIADKHVDLLVDAFDRVAVTHDVTLGIIGDGPEATRLREHAATLEYADRVTFLGVLDAYEDVLGQMRAARVVASPSTREGFGITYAEAMAADCTVSAAEHPESAADEVIGDAGVLVDPTVDALADALARALRGDRPRTAPVERAQRFDWDVVTEQAAAAYRRAIEDA